MTETLARVEALLRPRRPQLAQLFANCYPNTLDTTTRALDDGTTYVFTGDIPAMWLRDSSAQVSPYVRRLLTGVIRRQVHYLLHDPHANAFDPHDPATFSRPWFAWANSLFAEFVLHWLRARGQR